MGDSAPGRRARAVHAHKEVQPDPDFELGLAGYLNDRHDLVHLLGIYSRFAAGTEPFDALMRRVIWRAACRSFGYGVTIEIQVGFKHIETFEIGNAVFIGAQSYIQGRFDGRCQIGDHVWIGPQSYFDARDLVIEEYVGIGPGVKILGSEHSGLPIDVPIIQTDLEIKPVRVEAWADIGVNAVILPGVTIGQGSIVGAGSVVTRDVLPNAVVAGVPAKFLHWRSEGDPLTTDQV